MACTPRAHPEIRYASYADGVKLDEVVVASVRDRAPDLEQLVRERWIRAPRPYWCSNDRLEAASPIHAGSGRQRSSVRA